MNEENYFNGDIPQPLRVTPYEVIKKIDANNLLLSDIYHKLCDIENNLTNYLNDMSTAIGAIMLKIDFFNIGCLEKKNSLKPYDIKYPNTTGVVEDD